MNSELDQYRIPFANLPPYFHHLRLPPYMTEYTTIRDFGVSAENVMWSICDKKDLAMWIHLHLKYDGWNVPFVSMFGDIGRALDEVTRLYGWNHGSKCEIMNVDTSKLKMYNAWVFDVERFHRDLHIKKHLRP